ncbi:conserved hypothetical protein [uncultured Stenotrophomonas sp.]|uniref:Uncharacterized protein n=1 Tax=uncultured Stenotrophomonas sp. TaxID=165438 RepID=A0A1Y5Q683_9GAMM|nr:conserved hypothetical protein [uncultured Stenotrophomonas sp.]
MQDRIPLNIRADGWQASAAPLKVLADGSQIPADDPRTDHVAVLFPDGWLVSTRLTAADDGTEYDDSDDAVEAVKQERLLGFSDWINAPLDEVLLRHVIRHDRFSPAVDTNLFPNFPKSGWIRSDVIVGSSASAWSVDVDLGLVYGHPRSGNGFGLACRRAGQ